MANAYNLISFIKEHEGGLSSNPKDPAALYPVPDGTNNHTNEGITWATWEHVYGNSLESIQRWYRMDDDDFLSIYKPLYWDQIRGDEINSQRIADLLVDFAFLSGPATAIKNAQIALNTLGAGLVVDGSIIGGDDTINAINDSDENKAYEAIKAQRYNFINLLQTDFPEFITGWTNRLNDLVSNFGSNFGSNKNGLITILSLVLIITGLTALFLIS